MSQSETFCVPAPPEASDGSDYETYVQPLLNLANRYSHATRPGKLGVSTSEASEEFREQADNPAPSDWRAFLRDEYDMDENIDEAVEAVAQKIDEFRAVLSDLDRDTIRRWVEELVYEKSLEGHAIERRVMLEVANRYNANFEPNDGADESKGIDGYIDGQVVSVKPARYFDKDELTETIEAPFIVYDVRGDEMAIRVEPRLIETLETNQQTERSTVTD